jgi:hypothetical protein
MTEKIPVESGMRAAFLRPAAPRLAIVAGFFSMAVILLLLMNFHDMKQNDPMSSVNSRKLNALVAEHSQNPGDAAIKKNVQDLDQLIRQNYFNSQIKAKIGVFLLLAGLTVFILCLKNTFAFPVVPGTGKESGHNGYSRIALAAFIVFLMIVAIIINLIQSNSGG